MPNIKFPDGYTGCKIIYPEGEASHIIQGSYLAQQQGICQPWLIGDNAKIIAHCHTLNIPDKGWYESCLPENHDLGKYISTLVTDGMNREVAELLLPYPLYFSAMMLRAGFADLMVTGFMPASGEVINVATMIVGLAEENTAPTSYFLLEISGFDEQNEEMLVYADCGLPIHPTVEALADIVILTAQNIQSLLGREFRVKLLSLWKVSELSSEVVAKKILGEFNKNVSSNFQFSSSQNILGLTAIAAMLKYSVRRYYYGK